MEELRKESESYVEPQPTDGPEAAHLHPGQYYDEKWRMWMDKPKSNMRNADSTKMTIVESESPKSKKAEPVVAPNDDMYVCHEPTNDADEIPSESIGSAEEADDNAVVEVITSNSEEPATVIEESTEVIEPTEVITATEATTTEKSEETTPKEAVSKETSPPKATRISAKMRKRSRDEFCEFYLRKCDTKLGKPITIEPELMDRLYNICLLAGVRNACPTYLVNNLIREIISTWEEQAKGW